MQTIQDQYLTRQEVNRQFLLEEIERYFAGQIGADDLLCAIKVAKPAKEEEEC